MLPSVQISPEGLEVAEQYLLYNDVSIVAREMNLTTFEVSDVLETREVKKYIDTMYLESGYRNRNNIASALDSLIDAKMLEMEESEMGSNKDIAELLKMAHDMRMQEMAAMAKLNASTPTNQTNVQILNSEGGMNYNALLGKIMGVKE